MNRYITFTDDARKEIDKIFDLAEKVYGGDYSDVRILAGNFAGYGRHVAHYYLNSKIIEFPLNETFNTVKLTSKGYEIQDLEYFKGILLHELGHHFVNCVLPTDALLNKYLSEIVKAGRSTHTTAQWCYVCEHGWNYFDHDLNICHTTLARGLRKNIPGLAQAMSAFDPYNPPYEILKKIPSEDGYTKECQYCKQSFVTKRSDAKFCSAKCRVANSRQKK